MQNENTNTNTARTIPPPPRNENPAGWERDWKGRLRHVSGTAAHAMQANVQADPFIIDGALQIGRVTGVAGRAGFGKTIIATGVSHCASTGEAFCGLPIRLRGCAQILDNEMPISSVEGPKGRLAQLVPGGGEGFAVHCTFDEVAQDPSCRIQPELVAPSAPVGWRTYRVDELERFFDWQAEKHKLPSDPILWIIDSAAGFYSGRVHELSHDETRSLVDALRALALRRHKAIMLLFHTAQNPGQNPLDWIRGCTGWGDALDYVWGGRTVAEGEDAETGLHTDIRGKLAFGKAREFGKLAEIDVVRHGLELWRKDDNPPVVKEDTKKRHTNGGRTPLSVNQIMTSIRRTFAVGAELNASQIAQACGVKDWRTGRTYGEAAADAGELMRIGRQFRVCPPHGDETDHTVEN